MRKWGLFVAIGIGAGVTAGCLDISGDDEPPPTEIIELRSVSTGAFHACAVDVDGGVFCWGLNSAGQVGDPDAVNKYFPMRVVAGDLTFTSTDAGGLHTCAVASNGDAYCWGDNQLGQLGIGETGPPLGSPRLVDGGLTFAKLDAGGTHTCGITDAQQAESGKAYCWGSESFGQLGNGVTGGGSIRNTPDSVLGGLTFRSISVGASHTCGVTTDFAGYCWGRGTEGQLGQGFQGSSDVPISISGGLAFTEISAGDGHSCGVTGDLDVYCWGRGTEGQLGNGQRNNSSVPVKVDFTLTNLAGGVFVTAGGSHSCAVFGDETRCWGLNDAGYLGDGTTTDSDTPVEVVGGLSFANVSAGSALRLTATCGITLDDTVYCWGSGTVGQLGNGDDVDQPTPVPVSGQNQ